MPKPPSLKQTSNLPPRINTLVESYLSDSRVTKFNVTVNKRAGVVKVNAQTANGTITRELLGPGLEAATRYDSSANGRSDRDANIRTLLARGLTQMEVAERIGVSQALVSKVKRTR